MMVKNSAGRFTREYLPDWKREFNYPGHPVVITRSSVSAPNTIWIKMRPSGPRSIIPVK